MDLKGNKKSSKNKNLEINMKTNIWEALQEFILLQKVNIKKPDIMKHSCKEHTKCTMPKIHQSESSFNRLKKRNKLKRI